MQSIDERMFYRVRKTTLEMLRDRGYELPEGAIEEDFEAFKLRFDENKNFNMLIYRPCQNENAAMMVDENQDGEVKQMVQPIFVVFHMDGTSLSNQAIAAMV